MPVKYALQPNPTTPDPNDQSARVVTAGNLTLDDIATEIANRGTATSKALAKAILAASQEIMAEKIADGYAINTPLFTARPGISGVFTDPTDTFDDARHTKRAVLYNGPMLVTAMAAATVEKVLRPAPEPLLEAFINKVTGGVNATITPGGIGQITGGQLKFDPAVTAAGIYFVPTGGGAAVKVPTANLGGRTEGELIFTTPALAAGTYRLEVRRAYGAALTIRTGQLGMVLTVA